MHELYPVCQKSAESPCEDAGREEDVDSELHLVAAVVHGNDINAAWIEPGFKDTEQHSASDETAKTLAEALPDGDNAPEEDVQTQPELRLYMPQDQIARDLEQDEGDEEDEKCNVELVPVKT